VSRPINTAPMASKFTDYLSQPALRKQYHGTPISIQLDWKSCTRGA